MEKKETKRYTIVEYNGFVLRKVNNEEEYEKLVKYIKKINNRIKSNYYFGNLSKKNDGDKILIKIHIYKKLSPKRTISDIDSETTKYVSIKDMLDKNYSKLTNHYNPDIYITYFEELNKSEKKEQKPEDRLDIRIRALPLLFECDRKYFSENYIRQALDCFAKGKNIDFFREILEKYKKYRSADRLLDELQVKVNDASTYMKRESQNAEVVLQKMLYLSSTAKNIYRKICIEHDKNGKIIRDIDGNIQYSHRRVRDFGVFVREYVMPQNKRISSTRYNVRQDPRNIGSYPTEEEMEVKYLR